MKWLLIFWATPLTLLGSWYWLSYFDINFGYLILSRPMHDLVFEIYGHMLGIAPENIPPLVLKAVIVDSLLLFSVVAYRRRKAIAAWWHNRNTQSSPAADFKIDESLSSAP